MADGDTVPGDNWFDRVAPTPADPDYSTAADLLLELIAETVQYILR